MTADMLTTADVAAILRVDPATVHSYRSRNLFPPPDGMVGRTPWWTRETIEAWQATRPGQGWRGKG